jgi:hypothetical protein
MQEPARVIEIPQNDIERQAMALPEKARLIVVEDNEAMEVADRAKDDIKQMIKTVDEFFKPMADKAFQAHRAITGKWNEVKNPLVEADKYLTGQVKGYLRKCEEIRLAEERRLAEIARKAEEERRLAEAVAAEKEGNHEEAEAIIQEPIYVPPPVVESAAPKADGRKYRTLPRARVIDKMKVIKAVAMNPALQDLLDINISVANQKAKSLGKALDSTIPGLQYFEE